jgi:hypothetical protein
MSAGKVTLLSADSWESGATVGSSSIGASDAAAAGGFALGVDLALLAGAVGFGASPVRTVPCAVAAGGGPGSAARNVTNTPPANANATIVTIMIERARLFICAPFAQALRALS